MRGSIPHSPQPAMTKTKQPPKWTWAQTRTEDVGPANDGMGVLPPWENDTRSLAREYIMTLYLALGWDRQKKKKQNTWLRCLIWIDCWTRGEITVFLTHDRPCRPTPLPTTCHPPRC